MISSHLVGVNALGQVHREVRQYAARPLLPQNILYFSWNLIIIYSNFSLNLDSTAVSIFVVILVELTNTETAVVSPPRALLNFLKATTQRGELSGALFL